MSAISIFDIFKVGIGPSSSHTVGPMKAAREFAIQLESVPDQVASVQVTLYGSLAYTGKGHGTDSAIILGLMGMSPATIDPDAVEGLLRAVHEDLQLDIPVVGRIPFDPASHLIFNYDDELDRHTNGMRFVGLDANNEELLREEYFSLGGGFIARGDDPEPASQDGEPKYTFDSGDTLLAAAEANGLSITELVFENECQWRSAEDVTQRIDNI